MTEFEEKLFARFVRNHRRGFHDFSLQLEGNKAIAVVRAGLRLIDKGLLVRHHRCHWYLTERGRQLAEQRQDETTTK